MITLYNTLNDKLIRFTETEYSTITSDDLRSVGPVWIDDPDVEMVVMHSKDRHNKLNGSSPDYVAVGWKVTDKKKRYENSITMAELESGYCAEDEHCSCFEGAPTDCCYCGYERP
jgi:hypothetical protein